MKSSIADRNTRCERVTKEEGGGGGGREREPPPTPIYMDKSEYSDQAG